MDKIIANTIKAHQEALDYFKANCLGKLKQMAVGISESLKQGGTVYLCGNGGSAADCQHVSGELIGRFRKERAALAAVALSTDTSIMTSVGNDYSFDDIFARQVEGLVKKGDILWAFSTSGSSANVIKAAKLAKEKQAMVLSFTGRPASQLEEISDICLCAESEFTSTSQEIGMLAYHIICELVDIEFANCS